MTLWKDSAQTATLQHRLLPTDGYQWQGMAAQHRQGPMHSCSLLEQACHTSQRQRGMPTHLDRQRQRRETYLEAHLIRNIYSCMWEMIALLQMSGICTFLYTTLISNIKVGLLTWTPLKKSEYKLKRQGHKHKVQNLTDMGSSDVHIAIFCFYSFTLKTQKLSWFQNFCKLSGCHMFVASVNIS